MLFGKIGRKSDFLLIFYELFGTNKFFLLKIFNGAVSECRVDIELRKVKQVIKEKISLIKKIQGQKHSIWEHEHKNIGECDIIFLKNYDKIYRNISTLCVIHVYFILK